MATLRYKNPTTQKWEFVDSGGLIVSESGIAGIRVWGGKLQYKQSDGTWVDIVSVGGSSSGGSSEPPSGEIADESDIDSLFP